MCVIELITNEHISQPQIPMLAHCMPKLCSGEKEFSLSIDMPLCLYVIFSLTLSFSLSFASCYRATVLIDHKDKVFDLCCEFTGQYYF